jgi:hypothetical protein
MRKPPSSVVYAVATYERFDVLRERSSRMASRETFTMVMSSSTMHWQAHRTERMRAGRSRLRVGAGSRVGVRVTCRNVGH